MRPAKITFMLLLTCVLFPMMTVEGQDLTVEDALREGEPGLWAAYQSDLGVTSEQSQSVDDITVNLEWAYADEQRAAFIFSIEAEDPQKYSNLQTGQLNLSSPEIEEFSATGGSGFGTGVVDGQSKTYAVVDMGDQNLPDEVTLDVEVDITYVTFDSRTQIPPSEADRWFQQTNPVTFIVTVPVNPINIIEPNLQITDSGFTITLEEVIVSPSGLEITLCHDIPDKPENEDWQWLTVAQIVVNEGERSGSGEYNSSTGCNHLLFPVTTPGGTVTLSVDFIFGMRNDIDLNEYREEIEALGGEFHTSPDSNPEIGMISMPEGAREELGFEERIYGDWVFEFDVPAAKSLDSES